MQDEGGSQPSFGSATSRGYRGGNVYAFRVKLDTFKIKLDTFPTKLDTSYQAWWYCNKTERLLHQNEHLAN